VSRKKPTKRAKVLQEKYLENAEHCLINHLFANQFKTGDFGSKYLDPEKLSTQEMKVII
jgi:hypothetical protein